MKPLELQPHATGAEIQALEFAYERSVDQDKDLPARHPVVVVGAGPVGLSLAIDLAQRGQKVVLLDNDNCLSTGSRAICFAKRTLEIWDRLGIGESSVAKGVSWNVGRVFLGDEQVFHFDLLPEAGHERPAFVNLQQYYAEAYLLERASRLPNLEIRWKNEVAALEQLDESKGGGVLLGIDTPDGRYELIADYVSACDGGRSAVRRLMGLESKGRIFQDRFLIADVKMAIDFPAERWFWFDPPFHRNQSVLLHRQPDGVWRIDFQLGWDADPEEEKKLERITPRVNAMMLQALGHEVPFELQWASVYTFVCLRMDRFRHGRVIFAGDSAHGVSPFGARGANSGVQDADNLGWKLDLVLRGEGDDALLDSYGSEREYAADENLLNSTRATDFITPKSEISKLFRNSVLQLAGTYDFARRVVNSGRLSVPATLRHSPLNTPDRDTFEGAAVPGAPALDAAVQSNEKDAWLLRHLGGDFQLLIYGDQVPPSLADCRLKKVLVVPQGSQPQRSETTVVLRDHQGSFAKRYDATAGSAWLVRPDQHICARWRTPSAAAVAAAHARATGHLSQSTPVIAATAEVE
ncbi:FAD-dependent oxidoreductase [Variovorax sp. J22R133]|uniref:FAD-dependent oxidoreductase n=1 Tax=Variovorax brevis TaxID=3053503 RepID=UPI002575F081|nr:FAD-dependent oxidoreductase [Variovorax sp. J22R133]MDM0116093.1 FAD-dependent oxidoreductase [Variovorax sp. J22R133]